MILFFVSGFLKGDDPSDTESLAALCPLEVIHCYCSVIKKIFLNPMINKYIHASFSYQSCFKYYFSYSGGNCDS